ncbi:MAG TPA: hypothetical protein VII25_11375 [Candidatus Acidoferrum sp.]|jgi:hypothetical protein
MVPNRPGRNEQLERDTLRFLCSILIQPTTRGEILGLLDGSQFSDMVCRVIFEEIRSLGPVPSRTLRELLPARIANRGFPDFDLKDFLGNSSASESEVEELYMSVLEMIEVRHREDGPALTN